MIFEAGTYIGNGTGQTIALNEISGVPDLVFIKAGTGTRFGIMKMNAGYYAATESERWTPGTNSTTSITALSSGSFTVGNAPQANDSGVTFYYFAIFDDGNGDFEIGSYTGDGGTATRDITGLGFDNPECVWVGEDATAEKWWHTIAHGPTTDSSCPFTASAASANRITDIATPTNGFTVDETNLNVTGVVYVYAAWKTVAGKIGSLSYTGDGNDNRQIATDAVPEFVLTHGVAGRAARWRAEESGRGFSGDLSGLWDNGNPGADAIQGFGANYFEIGTSANVNGTGDDYRAFWLASNPAGGGGATAAASLTSQPTTLSASATFSPGTKTASAALTSAPTTLAATATHDAPVYTATAGLASQPSTLAADATFTGVGTFTASAALTSAPTTLAATAEHVTPTYTAAAALASQPSALSATAEVTNPVYEATAALTSQPTTLAATALHSPSVSLASAALVSQPGTLAASVLHTTPVYTAAAALMSAVTQLSAAAQVVNPTYTATASLVSQSSVLGGVGVTQVTVIDLQRRHHFVRTQQRRHDFVRTVQRRHHMS